MRVVVRLGHVYIDLYIHIYSYIYMYLSIYLHLGDRQGKPPLNPKTLLLEQARNRDEPAANTGRYTGVTVVPLIQLNFS